MSWWRVVGLLSGTSMDGIDVAGVALRLQGDTIELRVLGAASVDYPADLRRELLSALPPAPCDAATLCRLDTLVGQRFAEAAQHGMQLAGGADVIASLGQTLFHWVADGQARGSLQIGQPAWIAEATGLPVISDLRVRDITAGGHGAPLAGVLDALWLADRTGVNAAVNIGGIANITVVGGPQPRAYDTGPGNALLDAAARRTGREQDTGGALAQRGTVHDTLLEHLLADEYYAQPAPKSTGKEHFNADYLDTALGRLDEPIADADLLATLTELTARTIGAACRAEGAEAVIVSGGGVHNPALLAALRRNVEATVHVSDELGIPAESKEAILTALLGFLSWHSLPGNTPGTTGAAGPRTLGCLTPGSGPLRMPEPATDQPTRLRVLTA